MIKRPHILITNDDGIEAPGLRYLWEALSPFAKVTVIAPASEQSAVGLSITTRVPLKITQLTWPKDVKVWSISGTPADCIKLGLHAIVDETPDLIASGINRGTNAGRNILYSGTVGAAIEGVMHNIPSIAFSCSDYDAPEYFTASLYIPRIVNYVLEHHLATDTLLNVNFPLKTAGKIQGFKLTRQGKEMWVENPDKRSHPFEGHEYYWLGAKLLECQEEEESDVAWLRKGYITAVPVHIGELTDHRHLETYKQHFEERCQLE